MPTYGYCCPKGHHFDTFTSIGNYVPKEICPQCGAISERYLTPQAISGDYAPYNCPITGQLISGKKEHEANLRKHGCRIIEKGEREDFDRRKASRDESFRQSVRQTVAEEIAKLPEEKLTVLEKELQSAKINYSRSTDVNL